MAEELPQKNLGTAQATVHILSSLPYVRDDSRRFDFDLRASDEMYEYIKNVPYMQSLFVDQIKDTNTLSAFLPSQRIYSINNYMDNGQEKPTNSEPYISWTPCKVTEPFKPIPGFMYYIQEEWPKYILEMPNQGGGYSNEYDGPRWKEKDLVRYDVPDDRAKIDAYFNILSGWAAPSPDEEEDEEEETINESTHISPYQSTPRRGLWWGIESSPFLSENMPFWVHIKRKVPSTTLPEQAGSYPTFFVISLGMETTDQRYDIVIDINGNPQIIDYYTKDEGKKGYALAEGDILPTLQEQNEKEWARVTENDDVLVVKILTIAGRLVVSVNGIENVYTRVSKEEGSEGEWREVKIAKGSIRIYGTNIEAAVYASPMTFAPLSVMSLPLPTYVNTENGTRELNFRNVTNQGKVGKYPVCVLPKEPSEKDHNFGVDCRYFFQKDADGNGEYVYPRGAGFHQKGGVAFSKAGQTGYNLSSLPDTSFYVVVMSSEDVAFPGFPGKFIKNGGAPIFFRLKGIDTYTPTSKQVLVKDVTENVLEVSETAEASDYFHVERSANVTLYNENGEYDHLRDVQRGIRIYWGWGDEMQRSFTGIITSITTNEVPGKETITLNCSDYTYILKNNVIINSPFYEGMIAYYAVKDIAERAGIEAIQKDWHNEREYFLPAGYSHSEPRMRFPPRQSYFECIMEIVKRFEAFIYFDPNGIMHVEKLPGGLFSVVDASTPVTYFTSHPRGTKTILQEKSIDWSFESTVNAIFVLSIGREINRHVIVKSLKAKGDANNLQFKKIYYLDQPALGDSESVRQYAYELAKRIFFPVRRSSFRTAGENTFIDPLSYIVLDDVVFRVLSIKRDYNAEQNSFTNDYECEWLGGR